MQKKYYYLIALVALLGIGTYVFTSTNLLKGAFEFGDRDLSTSPSVLVSGSALDQGTVALTVYDEFGNQITDLEESDFTAVGSTHRGINGFQNLGGLYLFQLVEGEYYIITAEPDSYVSEQGSYLPVPYTEGDDITPETLELNYAYKVWVFDGQNYYGSSDVYAGDLNTECEVKYDTSGDQDLPVYVCMIPLEETAYEYRVETTGYDTITGSFNRDRTSHSDSDEVVQVDLVIPEDVTARTDQFITVYDEFGNKISGLSEDMFSVTNEDGYSFEEFEEVEDGIYRLRLKVTNTTAYDLTVEPEGYVSSTVELADNIPDYETETMHDFAFRVMPEDDNGDAVEGAEVVAAGVTCEEKPTGGIYGCAVPVSETDLSYYVEADGFETYDGEFEEDRTSDTDSAVTDHPALTTEDEDSRLEDLLDDLEDEEKTLDDANDLSDDEEEEVEEEEETDDELTEDEREECTDAFRDTDGHWAEDAICLLYQREIVEGRSEGYYVPDDYVTKAEFLKMVLLSNGFEVNESLDVDTYSDVNPGDWHYYYVALADSMKDLWFSGDGTWSPNSDITRGDAILLTVRLSNKTLYGYDEGDIPFDDVEASSYQTYAIILGEQYGVIQGYEGTDEFRPNNKITRAEAAIMVIRSKSLFE